MIKLDFSGGAVRPTEYCDNLFTHTESRTFEHFEFYKKGDQTDSVWITKKGQRVEMSTSHIRNLERMLKGLRGDSDFNEAFDFRIQWCHYELSSR